MVMPQEWTCLLGLNAPGIPPPIFPEAALQVLTGLEQTAHALMEDTVAGPETTAT